MRRSHRIGVAATAAILAAVPTIVSPAYATHTKSLVQGNAATTRGAAVAINDELGTSMPSSCFTVWVTTSDARWATWTWSDRASSNPRCQLSDQGAMFFRKTAGGNWVYAGKPTDWLQTKCTFVKAPGGRVAADLGCHRWRS